ncbi:hypothetical protein [Paraburkholderia heleia]|uniref:hypothetical protein n=2 Tax=Paraburkholderia heleia TaxID=634127 RepID=UPI0005A71D9A|nr:hypothetical protein [Paraburkholderia heleia]
MQHDATHRIVANGVARKESLKEIKLFVSQWSVKFGIGMIEFHGVSVGQAVDTMRFAGAVIAADVQRNAALTVGIFGKHQGVAIFQTGCRANQTPGRQAMSVFAALSAGLLSGCGTPCGNRAR